MKGIHIVELARVPLLAGVTVGLFVPLAEQAKRLQFGAGDVIVRQGDAGTTLFVITEGWVQVVLSWDARESFGEVVLQNLGPGQIFGELAVLDDLPRSASAVATEPVVCYEFPRDAMTRLIDESPGFRQSFMGLLAARVREANDRVALEARDPLTDLPNRSVLNEFYDRIAASTQRHGGDLALALVDVDYLKSVNDRYGHSAGDHVLRAVAETLRSTLRRMDLAVRFGGDEFAVLLPNTGPEGAHQVMARLRSHLADRANLPAPTSVSYGISAIHCPPGGEIPSLHNLLILADQALYSQKEARPALE